MKKVLFWLTGVVVFPLFFMAGLLEIICCYVKEVCYGYEGWCMDYNKHSEYLGDGMWTTKHKVDQDLEHLGF